MADLSYTVAIEAGGAQATLAKLNKQVDGVSNAFSALKTALAGIAFGSLIANANKFADSISDMSDATEIAISTIMGFNKALMENGGDAEAATNSIGKFAQAIGDAIGGSDSAQKAFSDVGVSLKDIQTLSNEDLLKKTVAGLGQMESSAKRITTQVALFGKSARSVNFAGVGEGMGPAAQASEKYTQAIQSGAAAQQALEINMKNMTTGLLQVIQPLNDIVAGINISVDAFASLFKVLGYAAGAFLIFGKGLGTVKAGMDILLPALRSVGGVFAWFSAQVMLMVGNFGQIFTNLARMVAAFGGAGTASVSLAAALAAALRVGLRFLGLVGVVMAVVEAVNFLIKAITGFDVIDWVIDKFKELYEAGKKFFGIGSSAGGGRGGTAETLKAQQEQAEKVRKEYEATAAKAKEFQERQSKLAVEITKVGDAMKFAYDRQLQQVALETRLVGKTDDQVESLRAVAQLYEKQDDAIKGLLETRAQWAQGTEEQKASLGIIDAQIAKIKEMTAVQEKNLTEYIDRLQVARILEKDRLQVFEEITKQMDRQAALGDQLRSANDQMKDVQFQAEQHGKSPLEQQLAQIKEDARKAALEAGRAFAAGFEDGGDGLTPEKAKELSDGLAQIAERYKAISDQQIKSVEASRTFEDGWTQAFNNYADSATNAAKRAGDIFNSVTSNMNSAIDNFVDNGKFSFGDLATSIIKDMLKIELKASAMNLMNMMKGTGGGSGGLFSSIGSMLGFAEGGNPPIGKASIVGENGPEVIVPRTASTVIPNGGGGGTTHNTYITNNISAIDSKSVAQLFAENRKTLLGSVKMAEKELPYKV